MIEVLNVSSGRSSATQDKWPRAVLPRSFDFGFAAGLCLKDVRLCLAAAHSLGVPLHVGNDGRGPARAHRRRPTAPMPTSPP